MKSILIYLPYFILLLALNSEPDTSSLVQLDGIKSVKIAVVIHDYSKVVAFAPNEWEELERNINRRIKDKLNKDGIGATVIQWVHGVELGSLQMDITICDNPKIRECYGFNVEARFIDSVKLERDTSARLPEGGITWIMNKVGLEKHNNLETAIIASVDLLLERFIATMLFENGSEINRDKIIESRNKK
ncbi:MAG TPA: hypothetical protein VLX68_14555 [Chitinivibrionales bacterium]|nr:hypothetical protein [Chitinivibrionales bacterium]